MSTKEQFGTAQSMKAAASLSGYSEAVLKRAKSEGCPAFIGSRVNVDDLIEWIDHHTHVLQLDPVNKLEYETKLIKKRQAEFEFQKLQGLHVPLDVLRESFLQNQVNLRSLIQKALCQELPAKGEMQDAPALRELGGEMFETICERMQKGVEQWIEE